MLDTVLDPELKERRTATSFLFELPAICSDGITAASLLQFSGIRTFLAVILLISDDFSAIRSIESVPETVCEFCLSYYQCFCHLFSRGVQYRAPEAVGFCSNAHVAGRAVILDD